MYQERFIPDFLQRAVTYYPEKIAVIEDDMRLTYRQFQERVNRLSQLLTELGVQKGDRVPIWLPTPCKCWRVFTG